MKVLIEAAKALIDSITFDDSGNEGRGGNGGLLSRKTIRHADELRLKIQEAEALAAKHSARHKSFSVWYDYYEKNGCAEAREKATNDALSGEAQFTMATLIAAVEYSIQHVKSLNALVDNAPASQPKEPPAKVMWAFPQEDGTFDAALLFETEDEADSFDREAIEEWGSGSDTECVEVLVSITRKVGLS